MKTPKNAYENKISQLVKFRFSTFQETAEEFLDTILGLDKLEIATIAYYDKMIEASDVIEMFPEAAAVYKLDDYCTISTDFLKYVFKYLQEDIEYDLKTAWEKERANYDWDLMIGYDNYDSAEGF